ncbi:MAG TPA: succinate--CoA ligase subunit alpha [Chitinivibrionales bacterium]|jgi:succinyl-CoA synthetase alpha subunit|nr:succinate--CoA ligase subunit alpha [Chitinivibrionales bacterium]
MSILVGKDTRVIVQGITGRDGSFHAAAMLRDGTAVVGGVTPGKGGTKVESLPVYNTVEEAKKATNANCSIVFVPARNASSAIREAADGCIPLIVCITEKIPALEMIENYHYVKGKGVRLIGPNCPGLISPGKSKVGIMPGSIHREGPIGVISRSGTLTYEIVSLLTRAGLGQSTCVGIGGDPVKGTGFVELLELFEADSQTRAVVLVGEIGGDDEEKAAEHIRDRMKKPVVAFVAGQTAPLDKRMGHAGAIVSGGMGGAAGKIEALKNAGVVVVDRPDLVPEALGNI